VSCCPALVDRLPGLSRAAAWSRAIGTGASCAADLLSAARPGGGGRPAV